MCQPLPTCCTGSADSTPAFLEQEAWTSWCDWLLEALVSSPPTPISLLFYGSIIFQHNPHACWCICPILVWAYKVCCGRTWTPAFTVIHTHTFLLPYCGIGDLPSVIWAAKQILPLMLCSHASFFGWSDGYNQHHGRLTVFLHAPPAYISISWQWILMGPSVDII